MGWSVLNWNLKLRCIYLVYFDSIVIFHFFPKIFGKCNFTFEIEVILQPSGFGEIEVKFKDIWMRKKVKFAINILIQVKMIHVLHFQEFKIQIKNYFSKWLFFHQVWCVFFLPKVTPNSNFNSNYFHTKCSIY